MYINEAITIGRTDDGSYVVGYQKKVKKEKDSKSDICCPSSEQKTLICKDEKEVVKAITAILPKIKGSYVEEDEFGKEFDKATK